MEVNLSLIKEAELHGAQPSILNSIRLTLQSPLAPPAKAAQIADELHLRFSALDSSSSVADCRWDTWVVLVQIVSIIPPDHQWQSILSDAISLLRDKELVRSDGLDNENQLGNLSGLPEYIRDVWFDPTEYEEGPDQEDQIDQTEFEEDSTQENFKWKNLNSFIARLTSHEFRPWLNLPIWQLRTALENEPKKGVAMDCRLWVASEWIIRCGKVVFEEMISNRELDESSARALGTGPLFEGNQPLSLERWQFWRDGFLNISKNGADLELDEFLVRRMASTAQKMDVIKDENSHSVVASNPGARGRDSVDSLGTKCVCMCVCV